MSSVSARVHIISLLHINGDPYPYLYWYKKVKNIKSLTKTFHLATGIPDETLLKRVKKELGTGDIVDLEMERGGKGMILLDYNLIKPFGREVGESGELKVSIWGSDFERLKHLDDIERRIEDPYSHIFH